jgi:hypothetical protein
VAIRTIRTFEDFNGMLQFDDIRSAALLCEIQSQVPAARKRIYMSGFSAIRARILEICIALQDMFLPAPQLIEIVTQACAPFALGLPYHYLWRVVVLVRHLKPKTQ